MTTVFVVQGVEADGAFLAVYDEFDKAEEGRVAWADVEADRAARQHGAPYDETFTRIMKHTTICEREVL